MTKKINKDSFDKYSYYLKSVQSPDNDVDFLSKTYKELKGKLAHTLREDFCGTFKIACEWVKYHKNNQAIGIDIDPEPIEYGKNNYLSQLTDDQKSRVKIVQESVTNNNLPKADIIAAQNFSYYLFKKRADLLEYFKNTYKAVNENGIFVIDSFGGPRCQEENEEETEHDGFSYFWDQDSFDPVTNYAQFYIHFKRKGEKKRERVFSYDWRMWTIPELKEIMEEAGFKKIHVYWEGSDDDGDGDGEFSRVTTGEECESWVAYVVGEK